MGVPLWARQVHHPADLLPLHLAERPPKNGEVLGIDIHLPAVDQAIAGYDTIAQKIARAIPILLE